MSVTSAPAVRAPSTAMRTSFLLNDSVRVLPANARILGDDAMRRSDCRLRGSLFAAGHKHTLAHRQRVASGVAPRVGRGDETMHARGNLRLCLGQLRRAAVNGHGPGSRSGDGEGTGDAYDLAFARGRVFRG